MPNLYAPKVCRVAIFSVSLKFQQRPAYIPSHRTQQFLPVFLVRLKPPGKTGRLALSPATLPLHARADLRDPLIADSVPKHLLVLMQISAFSETNRQEKRI